MLAHKERSIEDRIWSVRHFVIVDGDRRGGSSCQRGPGGIRKHHTECLRPFAVTIIDDWHSNGLRGFTGGKVQGADSGLKVTAAKSLALLRRAAHREGVCVGGLVIDG